MEQCRLFCFVGVALPLLLVWLVGGGECEHNKFLAALLCFCLVSIWRARTFCSLQRKEQRLRQKQLRTSWYCHKMEKIMSNNKPFPREKECERARARELLLRRDRDNECPNLSGGNSNDDFESCTATMMVMYE